VTGAHRAIFALPGLSAYEMRLALAPILADVETRRAPANRNEQEVPEHLSDDEPSTTAGLHR
jgi:hypothetical protein